MYIPVYMIAAAVFAAGVFFSSRNQLHMAQFEGYKPRQYWWRIKNNKSSMFAKEGLVFIVAVVSFVFYRSFRYSNEFVYTVLLVWSAVSLYIMYPAVIGSWESKKPLVFTHRATRLFAINALLLMAWGFLAYTSSTNLVEFLLFLSGIRLMVPINMLISSVLIYPAEKALQYRYIRSARIKLSAMKELKVIGITGSYGKTSTKYFLNTILSEKYNSLMTPESYNTLMGVTKVIREQLTDDHEVFVCEMGARNIGDIKALCRLVNPAIGILTSIGPQHLETFKTITNVVKTKYELIQYLPYYGTAIFNGDNSYCLELARKTGIETLIYGVTNKEKDIYIYADEIKTLNDGLRFRVKVEDGIDFECHTSLLGKHNVNNILGAICAAIKLGLSVEEIKAGILKIKPVPHRLELTESDNGLIVIDDTHNSNPEGSREALDVLKEMPGKVKVVVTPGMVELGPVEYEENKKFGALIADSCDYAILIGKRRSSPIIEGLRHRDFPREKIIVVKTLSDGKSKLEQFTKPGDVVLFENSLPDNYNEE